MSKYRLWFSIGRGLSKESENGHENNTGKFIEEK